MNLLDQRDVAAFEIGTYFYLSVIVDVEKVLVVLGCALG